MEKTDKVLTQMSLRQQALSGIYWTFIQQISTQGLSFLVSIILARILLPEEFGLLALIGIFVTIGNILINSGISQSLIRTNEIDEDDYSTAFYFNLIISFVIYLIIYLSAPLIANFYHQPQLINLTRVYALTFVISSLSLVQYSRLNKDLDFKKQTIIAIPSLIISGTTGIIMALNNYGVWSLVWSAIIKQVAHTVQLWWWSPWKPLLRIKLEKLKIHFKFGYKLTIAGVLNALFQNIYTIIIGKFFDPTQVGFYYRANTLRQLPITNLGAVLNKVTYPLFSKIQDDDEQLKNVYKKIMQMSVFLVAPTLLFMAVLAEPLFRFLITEKWLPAVPYFQILCVAGISYPLNAYNLNVLAVKGRSDLILKLAFIKRIIIILVILIVFQWGIYGLLYGQVFLSILLLYINSYYCDKLISYSFISQLKHMLPIILISAIVSSIVYGTDYYLQILKTSDLLRLIISSTLGILIYIVIAHLLKFEPYRELKNILFRK